MPTFQQLIARDGVAGALPACKSRLVLCDEPFLLADRPELTTGCERVTLFCFGDLLGRSADFGIDGFDDRVRFEHGHSRIGAYSQTFHDLHEKSRDLARRFVAVLATACAPLAAGDRAPLLFCADEFFKFMLKAQAVWTIATDPAFDQIVVLQNRSCRSLDLLLRHPALGADQRVWMGWIDPAGPAGPQVTALRNVFARRAGNTSALRLKLERLAERSGQGAPAPDRPTADRRFFRHLIGSPALTAVKKRSPATGEIRPLHIAAATRAVGPLAMEAFARSKAAHDADLVIVGGAGEGVSAPDAYRLGPGDADHKAALVAYSDALTPHAAMALLDMFAASDDDALALAALDLRAPSLIARDLPHLLANAIALRVILKRRRPSVVVAFAARTPTVLAGIELARSFGVPSLAVELNTVSSRYPRYISAVSDWMIVNSPMVADDHAAFFGITRDRVEAVGLPTATLVAEDRRRAPPVITFISQPLTDTMLEATWRLLVEGVMLMSQSPSLRFKRHPTQGPHVDHMAERAARALGVKVVILPIDAPAGDVIASSDVVAGGFSTMMIEALLAGRRTLIVSAGDTPYPIRLDDIAGVPLAASAEQVAALITAMLDETSESGAVQRAREEFGGFDFARLLDAIQATSAHGAQRRRVAHDLPNALFVSRLFEPQSS